MRALSTAELMTVWELGVSQSPPQRSLTLLAAACAEDATVEEVARLSLGQCDARLLTLREWTFGRQLAAVSACPACRETVEFTIDAATLHVAADSSPGDLMTWAEGDWEVQFRLPNSLDLAGLDPSADNEIRRGQLLAVCVFSARRAGAHLLPNDLPPEVQNAISERMGLADPQADVQLALTCPDCGAGWSSPFDIVSFFWSEINAWAGRVLNDVHTLASAYGWGEGEIFALSPARREAYLQLVQG